ncbi:tetraacyldisaccharide 4'-kinase [Aestuariibacter salexigens]|uniref:tetraacyldisaccharide 4'-kinase n=1 Tax=Aestuariibacter salexigens TaxID=226010 RepID=UPI00041E3CDA|nr:tetraacyldisaccharide 4'-kinase [Aestuariibacter salexigens]
MKLTIQRAWYQPRLTPLTLFLVPFSWLFALISACRRLAYRIGLLSRTTLPVPVVVVGNITVGGSGKTPLVLKLAERFTTIGLKPGIVSRGYGGTSDTYPLRVRDDSDPAVVGDEPLLMAMRAQCPVVVDPKRARGARFLQEHCGCNVIICDDGLQHYALDRDIEIAVLDAHLMTGNAHLLPAGPLREGTWRLHTCDYTVINGALPATDEIVMRLKPETLRRVSDWQPANQSYVMSTPFIAVAGIGNPQRFFDTLRALDAVPSKSMAFPDHHQFSEADFPYDMPVIMTEKDAVKCRSFAKKDWYFLPVEASLNGRFLTSLTDKVTRLS